MARSAVIIDVDGVLNSFSNRKFYAQFIMEVGRSLRHLNPNRKNIIESIKAFRKTGANGLFSYLHCMCKNEEQFNKLTDGIINKLDFNNIPRNTRLKQYLESLSKDQAIIIRTDGLKEIAAGVWNSVIGPKFRGGEVIISDIRDNNFQVKTDSESWNRFAQKYNIDLSKSILLDDSKNNIETASGHGVLGCNVTKENPLMKYITKIVSNTLRQQLAKKMEIMSRPTPQEARFQSRHGDFKRNRIPVTIKERNG